MSNDKALTTYKDKRTQITTDVIQTVVALAPVVEAARMYGITNDQAAIIMFNAHELGLPYMPALNGLLFVMDTPKGKKVALTSAAMNALILNSGVLAQLKIKDLTDGQNKPIGCEVYMERADNGMSYTASFTQDDAQRIHDADLAAGRKKGLLDKYAWQAFTADMFYHRAYTKCARRICADVVNGLVTVEELGFEVDREGAPIVEGEFVETKTAATRQQEVVIPVAPTPSPVQVAQPAPTPAPVAVETPPVMPEPATADDSPPAALMAKTDLSVNDLIAAGFNPTDIMTANNRTIPGTSDECRTVLTALTAQGV